jgi:hypothetical protein
MSLRERRIGRSGSVRLGFQKDSLRAPLTRTTLAGCGAVDALPFKAVSARIDLWRDRWS